jgi:hypothetical protein
MTTIQHTHTDARASSARVTTPREGQEGAADMATSRKGTTDPIRVAFDAAKTPAQAAKALGRDPKGVRRVLRKQGVYVSKGHAFDAKAKTALWDALHAPAKATDA